MKDLNLHCNLFEKDHKDIAANEEDSTSDAADDKRVTAEGGFNALDVALRFAEECEEASPADVLVLKRLRSIAARKRCEKNAKQNCRTSYLLKIGF
ncbi:hypothetical protein QE152_g1391 [Popillia japonica]|uniref:Uncharacterized protein n=1 Tax=Popillia japonica TaxID=7064 RepID=A0AAW1N7I9_POPJA